jgi:hypothetical protein
MYRYIRNISGRKIYKGELAMENEVEDGLKPARGCLIGLIIGIVMWSIIIYCFVKFIL